MKITTLLLFISILSTVQLNAQQSELVSSDNETICQAELSKKAFYKALIHLNNLEINDTDVTNGVALQNKEDIIYTSKTEYYKALIKKNKLEMNGSNTTNHNRSLVLKNTEDIISNPKSRISYSH